MRQRILNRFARPAAAVRADEPELKSYILKLTDQWFGLT